MEKLMAVLFIVIVVLGVAAMVKLVADEVIKNRKEKREAMMNKFRKVEEDSPEAVLMRSLRFLRSHDMLTPYGVQSGVEYLIGQLNKVAIKEPKYATKCSEICTELLDMLCEMDEMPAGDEYKPIPLDAYGYDSVHPILVKEDKKFNYTVRDLDNLDRTLHTIVHTDADALEEAKLRGFIRPKVVRREEYPAK